MFVYVTTNSWLCMLILAEYGVISWQNGSCKSGLNVQVRMVHLIFVRECTSKYEYIRKCTICHESIFNNPQQCTIIYENIRNDVQLCKSMYD